MKEDWTSTGSLSETNKIIHNDLFPNRRKTQKINLIFRIDPSNWQFPSRESLGWVKA